MCWGEKKGTQLGYGQSLSMRKSRGGNVIECYTGKCGTVSLKEQALRTNAWVVDVMGGD